MHSLFVSLRSSASSRGHSERQMTGQAVARANLANGRLDRVADWTKSPRATPGEYATRGFAAATRLQRQTNAVAINPRDGRHGREERFGVRVVRRRQHRVACASFDDAAAIHDGDAIGEVGDHRDVVRDQEIGDIEAIAQVSKQIDDGSLYGNIERGDWLVADNELRLGSNGTRDTDALLFATAHLVGIAIDIVCRQPHAIEQGMHATGDLAGRHDCEALQRSSDDLTDRLAWVER